MGVIRALFRRQRLDEILDDEVSLHIELQTEEYVRDGLSPEEARRAAIKRFGRVMPVKESCREENGIAGVGYGKRRRLRRPLRHGCEVSRR